MNNKLPQIHLIYNRYKKASLTKKAAVEIRISYNYKQKYISTGIMLYSNQWKNGKIINCENILILSKILDKQISEVRQVLYTMIEENNINLFSIPEYLRKLRGIELGFLDFCNQRAEIRKYNKERDTQERYNRFLRLFNEWGGIKTFNDVNDSNIIAYDKYLEEKGMTPYSKWQNYHRFLNSFILDAVCEGYLHRNPYKWVNISKGKTSVGIDKCLTPAEFRKIKNTPMPTESLSKVRDVFVFQTYMCLRYSDLIRFDMKYVQEIKGMKVYITDSKKTRKPFTVPIFPSAMNILNKYGGHLPIISNVKYNLYLKTVAQAAGIDKPLSTHWARHTGATILINEGIDAKIIKKICGHSSTRITEQVYAKILDETVVDAVQDLDI